MNIDKVTRALKVCKGAVESVSPVPILSNYCFTKELVYGSNDVTTILVDLESEFEGGVKGDVFSSLLSTLKGDVKVSTSKEQLVLGNGKGKITIPLLPTSSFLFQPPEEKVRISMTATKAFFTGLVRCAETVGDDSMQRAFMGVTIEVSEDNVVVAMSSDNMRLSKFIPSKKNCKTEGKGTFVVQGKAVMALRDALEAAFEGEEKFSVNIKVTKAWLIVEGKGVTIYTRLIPDEPPDFSSAFKRAQEGKTSWCPVPEKLKVVLKQAQILTNKDPASLLSFTISGNEVKVALAENASSEGQGELLDSVKLAQASGSLEMEVVIDKIAKALDEAEEICFLPNAIGLRSGAYVCWVSVYGGGR